jgi:5'-methylthioadenosine phosphorylase
MKTIGIIGGSGLYELPGLKAAAARRVATPFGDPSDEFICGALNGVRMVFLPRHGRGHRILPSELNFRANIHGLKQLGVEYLISVGAVGSLRGEIAPGHVVVPDQFIDRTTQRASTFFGDGIVAHVMFADPCCAVLTGALARASRAAGAVVHESGTYLCMEGPHFSTRAESEMYRAWGATIIGMTALQEAKLAREAEMCFASLALVTDYDCWNPHAGDVAIADILAVLNANVALAQTVVAEVATHLPATRDCPCPSALQHAIITDRARIPTKVKDDLHVIIGKYL